jgi:hypothetical protein
LFGAPPFLFRYAEFIIEIGQCQAEFNACEPNLKSEPSKLQK